RVRQHPRPQHALGGHVGAHVDQHLIGGVDGGDGGGRLHSVGATEAQNDKGVKQKRQANTSSVHAPAFIRSCKCNIPTTFFESSRTGSAMFPFFSMTRTAVPARSPGAAVLGDRVMTSATFTSRNVSVFSINRVRSPAVTTPASVPPPVTTATDPRRSASSTTHSRIERSPARSGRSWVTITSATRRSSVRPS